MIDLLATALFFTGFVLVLVTLVLAVRRVLAPGGPVTLTVNGEAQPASAGISLLQALNERGVFLPAACAGRGMCGQCKVSLVDSPGTPLPTEMNHLSRGEARTGVRLACANLLRDDLEVAVPESLLHVRKRRCTVRSVRNVSTYLREVVLELPAGERLGFAAGQYVLIEAPAYELRFSDLQVEPQYRGAWERAQLFSLRAGADAPATRAYSLANSPVDDDRAVLVVRIALPPPGAPADTPPGIVSSYVFGLKNGDEVAIAGPFGDFHARETKREMVLIAGGAGIAPMRSIILDQLVARRSGRRISFWYGARSLQDLCYEAEFDALAAAHEHFSWRVALSEPRPEDAWEGSTGFIHNVVYERFLSQHPAPEELEYYLCGPPVMSVAVTQMLEDLGVGAESIFFDDFGSAR